ncbi:hypothetical protein [Pannonibacter sp.]|uniref:hypothetical protein n=1 Tax=Pannonibacter sp. TaxID=1906786 RepID=UPI003F6E8969
MTDTFNSLPWHDAELLELMVDRRNAGARDEVRLRVAWPQGDEATLLFHDCYAIVAEMNFGVIAEERIANGSLIDDDPGLKAIMGRWKPLGVSLEMLQCYRLETSSTSSVIRIYAKRFEVA